MKKTKKTVKKAAKKAVRKATKKVTKKVSKKAVKKPSKAKSMLRKKAKDHECFWMLEGHQLRSIGDLKKELLRMDARSFKHHVGHGNNDFANWVEFCFYDKLLADRMRKAKTKAAMAKLLK